ncbi:MAG: hypothetical protein QMD77_00905 [Patescibacteria group bacterium]|nr:hypothetical protein [Patescibacteria group bacterium]
MKTKNKIGAEKKKNIENPEKSGGNKALWWILGGCLALLVIFGLVLGGIAYWSYKKVKKEIKENKPKLEQLQNQMEKTKEDSEKFKEQVESTFEEEPQTVSPSGGDAGVLPENSERQMGYIKKVYEKGGKSYLNIDYIQWLTGDAAEKAMREDGECPKTGECIVLNDYYIRNVNPLIRTFEINPAAKIFMQTYSIGEAGGDISWNQPITYAEFKSIFTTNAKPRLKNVPYIVEIQNQKIVKITEQYIP